MDGKSAAAQVNISDIVEIVVKFKDGKVTKYKGEGIDTFISGILENYEISGEEKEPEATLSSATYSGMSLNYKVEKNKSPHDLAKEMQRVSSSKLKF